MDGRGRRIAEGIGNLDWTTSAQQEQNKLSMRVGAAEI